MKFTACSIVQLKNILILPFILVLFSISTELTAAPAQNKNGSKQSESGNISKELLQTKIEAIQTRQGVDENLKAKLLTIYQAAEEDLNNIEKYLVQEAIYKKAIGGAPEKTKKILKEISLIQQKQPKQRFEEFTRIATEELEQRLILEKAKVTNLDDRIKNKEAELALQISRPQLIREETAAAKRILDKTQKKPEIAGSNADSKLVLEAAQIQLKILTDARTAEIKMLNAEAISNPGRIELLKAEQQLLEIQKKAMEPVIDAIENLLSERRQQEAQEIQNSLSQAERELVGKPPVIQRVARENIRYSRDLQAITAKIEKYSEQKNRIDAEASEIENDFKSAQKKISLAGLSPALGRILREQRRNLINQNQFALHSESVQSETAATSLEQLSVDEKLKGLIDMDAALRITMRNEVDQTLPSEQRMMTQAELRVLLNIQKDVLKKLSIAYSSYLRSLGDLDFARQQLLNQAKMFAEFLDERLLWVPSSEPVNLSYPVGLYQSIRWQFDPGNWKSVMQDSVRIGTDNLLLAIILLLSVLSLRFCRKWAKRQLMEIADKVEKIYTDDFYYTWKALACVLILDLPLPLLIYFYGWFLSGDFHAADFSKSVGEGLQGASIPMFILQILYRLFAPDGIANKHFHWQKSNSSLLRKQLAWIRFFAVPGIFIVISAGAAKNTLYGDSLGRLALVCTLIAMSVFFGRILKPDGGLLQNHIKSYSDGWVARLRYVWYPLVVCIPLIVLGFAVAGYYLSALELQQKLIVTIRWAFFLVIFYELVIRWLILVNRQLALKNARQKRKAAMQAEKSTASGGEDPVVPIDEQIIDLPKINAQTIKLLNVFTAFSGFAGIWIIWKNILPAFSFLERIELWQHVVKIENQEIYQPITMANLLLAGFYAFIAAVSVRNFSGVMELLLFRRWSIETGERYAINQLAKYSLVAIGVFSVANELGGNWSDVQWLVAALGVGLGFGLQEIFANLVSGIILLFERPVRIGDTVTIGDVTGKVSRIQMRATTLIDWDQKELIIPNKTFITSQLVNWSLSDAITRIVIPVGIAFDSDVERAHKVMMDAVIQTPLVLSEPAPAVILVGFGENSLDFSIRIFVSELAHRLPVTHDLLVRLERALRENNIVIPFPQRDIHLRSVMQPSDLQATDNGSNKDLGISAARIVT